MPVYSGAQTFTFTDAVPLGMALSKRAHRTKSQKRALVIDSVIEGSAAEKLGVPAGAVITGINGKSLSPDEIWDQLSNKAAASVDNRPLTLEVYVEPPKVRAQKACLAFRTSSFPATW